MVSTTRSGKCVGRDPPEKEPAVPPPSASKPKAPSRRKSVAPPPPSAHAAEEVGQQQREEESIIKEETNVTSSPRAYTPVLQASAATPATSRPLSTERARSTERKRDTSRTEDPSREPLPDEMLALPPKTPRTPREVLSATKAASRRGGKPRAFTRSQREKAGRLHWVAIAGLILALIMGLLMGGVMTHQRTKAEFLGGLPVQAVTRLLWDHSPHEYLDRITLPFPQTAGLALATNQVTQQAYALLSKMCVSLNKPAGIAVKTVSNIRVWLMNIKRELVPGDVKPAAAPPKTFRDFLPQQAFTGAVAPCSAETLADVYHAGSRARKLPTVAVTCANAGECASAAGALNSAVSRGYVLHIDGMMYKGSEQGGQLQSAVASFYESKPNGILLLERVEQMGYEAFVVVNNILSENGSLQHEGRTVSTFDGLCVLISQLSSSSACSPDLETKVKHKLQRAVAAREGVEAKESNLGRALRRRIDFVVSAAEKLAEDA